MSKTQFSTNTHVKGKGFERDANDNKLQCMCTKTFGTCPAADFW